MVEGVIEVLYSRVQASMKQGRADQAQLAQTPIIIFRRTTNEPWNRAACITGIVQAGSLKCLK